MSEQTKNTRTLTGRVVSNKMDKTITVVIDRQVQHLVRLVDDLLDVSRVLRGKVELRREPLDIADAIAMAVETSRPIIDAQRRWWGPTSTS